MKPSSKIGSPSDLPGRMIRVLRAFGLGNPTAIESLGGTATVKYAVEVPEGRYVVRLRPSEFGDTDHTRFDHDCLERLAAVGLPVPRPRRTVAGDTRFVDGGEVFEVLSWLEGEPFEEGSLQEITSAAEFLSRFHRVFGEDIPEGKRSVLREDHPDLIEPYASDLVDGAQGAGEKSAAKRILAEIRGVRKTLDSGLYRSLPHVVIHGDFHPGNVFFSTQRVSAVFDFDYLSRQARIRDVTDGLIFFASRRDRAFDPHDIVSLTQGFTPDAEWCRRFLGAYADTDPLTDSEWAALPWMIRSRWIQMRLRGGRKVTDSERFEFVTRDFFTVIDWLEGSGDSFFASLRADVTSPGSQR